MSPSPPRYASLAPTLLLFLSRPSGGSVSLGTRGDRSAVSDARPGRFVELVPAEGVSGASSRV